MKISALRLLPFVVPAAIALGPSPVRATHIDDCTDLIDPDRTVKSCTVLIVEHFGDRCARAMIFNNRAVALSLLGRDEEAIADHDQAIAIDPGYPNAWYNRGHLNARRGNFEKAVADFDHLLKLESGTARAYMMRGYALEKLGAYSRAIADFSAAIALEPGMTASYNNRGVAYRKSGDLPRALADFDTALARDGNYINARINRAKTLAASGDHIGALVEFTNVVEQDRTAAAGWFGRAASHEKLGHVSLALSDYREAAALDPSNADAVASLQRLSRNH